MNKKDNILITGSTGLVGTALSNYLKSKGYKNIITPTSKECNLLDLDKTIKVFKSLSPKYTFHLAGFVKGIIGNKNRKGESFFKNTLINTNVIHASMLSNVKKVVAMGSGCVYPYPSNKDIKDEDLIFNGPPHPSEDSYAHSKRAMYAQLISYKEQYDLDFSFAISANLYGPNDLFDTVEGHVIPSLVKKFSDSSKIGANVEIWGDGSAKRDFLYSTDAARGLYYMMRNLSGAVNLGSGTVYSIKEIASLLSEIFSVEENKIFYNKDMPNGQEYRAYKLDRLNSCGFKIKTNIKEGLTNTANWFEKNINNLRKFK